FPVLVNALSGVVRSAGDAGLPARVPLVVPVAPEARPPEPSTEGSSHEDDDSDGEDDSDEEAVVEVIDGEPEPSEDRWLKFAMSALKVVEPHVGPLVGSLTGKLHKGSTGPQAGIPTGAVAPAADLGTHLDAIRAGLTSEEVTLAMQITDELSIAEKLAHVNRLRAMSVPEAVAYLRGELARRRTAPERALSVAELDAHLAAVRAALTAEESQALQLTLEELPSELRHGYRQKLAGMSVPEAVAYARRELAALGRNFAPPRRTDAPRTASAPTVSRGDAPSVPQDRHPAQRATSSTPGNRRRDGLRTGRSTIDGSRAPASVASHRAGPPTPGDLRGVVSPTTQSHIAAIQNELTPEEDLAVRTHLAAMSPADRSAWVSTLLMLPVPEAVATVRADLASRRVSQVGPGAPRSSAVASAPTEPALEPAPTAASLAFAMPEVNPPANAGADAMPADPELVLAAAPVGTPPTAPAPAGASVPAPEADTVVAPVPTPLPALMPAASSVPSPEPVTIAAPVLEPATVVAPVAHEALGPVTTSADAPRPRDTDAHRHLGAIESALTPEERHLVYAMIAQMSPEEREAWLDNLVSVSVPDGVAGLRDAIQGVITEEIQIPERVRSAPNTSDLSPDTQEPIDDPALDTADEVEDDQGEEDDEPAGTDTSPKPTAGARAARTAATAPNRPATLPDPGLPTLDAETTNRFRAIEQALGIEERMRLMELASHQPAAALRLWVAALSQLSVPEAVARLRVVLAEAERIAGTKKGGVS
ncbi:MAG TPA: hypothetical protein VFT22_36355, partial [Kofleriaceae bacterium]|nr:hypothetical protein [Kofleriaceae bacterium]